MQAKKSIAFLYTNDKHAEKEIMEIISKIYIISKSI